MYCAFAFIPALENRIVCCEVLFDISLKNWFDRKDDKLVGDFRVNNIVMDSVPASLINGYITEKGIIPPSAAWYYSHLFYNRLDQIHMGVEEKQN